MEYKDFNRNFLFFSQKKKRGKAYTEKVRWLEIDVVSHLYVLNISKLIHFSLLFYFILQYVLTQLQDNIPETNCMSGGKVNENNSKITVNNEHLE